MKTFLRILLFAFAVYMIVTGGLVWAFLLAPLLFGWTKGWKEGTKEVEESHLRSKVAIVAVCVILVLLVAAYFAFRVV